MTAPRWSERWHKLLACGARRRNQGRAFQRSGRVTGLRIEPGRLSARVQGSRATPYHVEALLPTLPERDWHRLVETVAGQVRFAAGLLAGRLPDGLLEALESGGIDLLGADVDARCACGEGGRCCAHLAALWEEAAERFAADPFALFALRGRGRQRLLADLAALRRRGSERPETVPLAALADRPWEEAAEPLDGLEVEVAGGLADPLRLLGDPPGWAGVTSAEEAFRPLADRAARRARELTAPD